MGCSRWRPSRAPALFAAKRAVIDGLRLPLDEGLRLEGRLFIECQTRPDTVALQNRVADAERNTPADQPSDRDLSNLDRTVAAGRHTR